MLSMVLNLTVIQMYVILIGMVSILEVIALEVVLLIANGMILMVIDD